MAIFSCLLFIKYHSFFTHHLKDAIRLEKGGKVMGVLSFLFLLTPLLLDAGWIWLLVLWLFVFWIYGNRTDRAVIVAFMIALLLLPSAVRVYSSFVVSLSGNGILDISRANTGVFNAELHHKLLAMLKKNPQDPDVLQAIGLVEKRTGKFKEAEQRFLQWAQIEPQAAAAFNNLGNIYLASNRTDQAVEAYQKAIQLEPTKTESYYNLGQAYLLNLLLNEAESEMRRAREIRPQLISFYTSISSRNPNRMAIDQTIDLPRIWKRVFTATPAQEEIGGHFWRILWGRVPLKYGEATTAALLVLLLIFHAVTRGKVLIRKCEKCGRLICSRCTRSMVIGNQCSSCVNAFTAHASADPQIVKQKRAEVAKYQDRKKSFIQQLSCLLPGGGHIWRGDSRMGVFYLFIFILFLMKLILWSGWIPSPVVLDVSFDLLWVIIFSALFLIFYGFVQYHVQIRSKERKF
jgi:tetratricopeptide (TPR) repeat protein